MTIIEELENQVKDNPILLYMKGSPEAPQMWVFIKSLADI